MKIVTCKKCGKKLAEIEDDCDRVYGFTVIKIKCRCKHYNKIELH